MYIHYVASSRGLGAGREAGRAGCWGGLGCSNCPGVWGSPRPRCPAGALGDEHPEVTWPWLGWVPRDKAVTAAVVPGQGHPEGWKGLGEEQAPPGFAAASACRPFWHSQNLPSRKRKPLAEAEPWDSVGCLLPGAQGSRGRAAAPGVTLCHGRLCQQAQSCLM